MIEVHDCRFNSGHPLKIEDKEGKQIGVGYDIMRPKLPVSMQNGNKISPLVGDFTDWLIAHDKVTRKLCCCN